MARFNEIGMCYSETLAIIRTLGECTYSKYPADELERQISSSGDWLTHHV